jgi:endonuclease YncB( thermonuclease family)
VRPLLVKGVFAPLGAAPDGDSIRFLAHDPTLWRFVYGDLVATSGAVQVRLEGIDAPETHYPSGGRLHRQTAAAARPAARSLLSLLGFCTVHRRPDETVVACGPPWREGFVLARGADRYGRCVALAFPGAIDRPDGSAIAVDEALGRRSANYRLLELGLVYPAFYATLSPALRSSFARAAVRARGRGLGIWARDASTRGVSVHEAPERALLLPRLFRYLADCRTRAGATDYRSAAELARFSGTRPERVHVLSRGVTTTFDRLLSMEGDRVALNAPPEDLVFAGRL